MRWLAPMLLAGCLPPGDVDLRIPVDGSVSADTWQTAEVEVSDLRLHWPVSAGLAPITAAWAHPGHGASGDVGGELLGTFTLTPERAPLGEAAVYAGRYVEASFVVEHVRLDGAQQVDLALGEAVTGLPVSLDLRGGETTLTLTWDADAALSEVDPDEPTEDALVFGILSTRSWSLEAR